MGFFGSLLGRGLGTIGSALLPVKGISGGDVGEQLGALAPFKHGGAVKKTGVALLHKGEWVIPANSKPTKTQRAVVAKNKVKAKAKGKKGKKGKK